MRSILRLIKWNQRGVTATESAIIITLVAAVAIPAIFQLGWASKDRFVCFHLESEASSNSGSLSEDFFGNDMSCSQASYHEARDCDESAHIGEGCDIGEGGGGDAG